MSVTPATISGVIILAVSGLFGYHKIHLSGQAEIARLQKEAEQVRQVQERRAQLSGALDVMDRYHKQLAPSGEADWLVQEVGRIARESSVHLTQIDPLPPRRIDPYTIPSVTLHFTCSYHTLGHFLSRLESADQFMQIESLDLSRAGRSADEATVTLTVSSLYAPPIPGIS